MTLAYSLAIAEYLLAAGALYGALRTAVPERLGYIGPEILLIVGLIALATGLLGALTTLTTRLRRTSQHQHRPGWGLMSAAARAAGTGLLWGVSALPVAWVFGLPLFFWSVAHAA